MSQKAVGDSLSSLAEAPDAGKICWQGLAVFKDASNDILGNGIEQAYSSSEFGRLKDV